MGGSKDTRGSDSFRTSFVRRVRDIGFVGNWLVALLVDEEGC